jgi:hypothetical protein
VYTTAVEWRAERAGTARTDASAGCEEEAAAGAAKAAPRGVPVGPALRLCGPAELVDVVELTVEGEGFAGMVVVDVDLADAGRYSAALQDVARGARCRGRQFRQEARGAPALTALVDLPRSAWASTVERRAGSAGGGLLVLPTRRARCRVAGVIWRSPGALWRVVARRGATCIGHASGAPSAGPGAWKVRWAEGMSAGAWSRHRARVGAVRCGHRQGCRQRVQGQARRRVHRAVLEVGWKCVGAAAGWPRWRRVGVRRGRSLRRQSARGGGRRDIAAVRVGAARGTGWRRGQRGVFGRSRAALRAVRSGCRT